QFNDAAIIQTVLSMLPDIVRAAAEPMASIGSLTVLSTDGASDVVKNATRTVAEASATVKGLTGIDIPDLLNQALGSAGSAGSDQPPTSGGDRPRPTPPSRGGGGAGGGSGGGPAQARGAGGGRGGSSPASGDPGAGTSAGLASAGGAAIPVAPRFESQEAIKAALADADRAIRAASEPATPRTDTAAGPPRPARPSSADITRDTTIDDAAQRLAGDLLAVPGIGRFRDVRLAQLDTSGPRPLRAMWRVAREHVDERFGQLTIGELLDRFGGDGATGT
ncbi:MAG: hypothetical protein WEG56_06565, partial [Chloroflexota bacterium]